MKNLLYLGIGYTVPVRYVIKYAFVGTKGWKTVLLVNFGPFPIFLASGFGSAFPTRIRIQIQDRQISADLDPQHWFIFLFQVFYFSICFNFTHFPLISLCMVKNSR